jgi:hypothetical protein
MGSKLTSFFRKLDFVLFLEYYSLVRIFKNTWFDRFARKEGIADEGKSCGYRVIVFFRHEERTFYQYGFAKSSRDNIDGKELQMYKKLAKAKFAMSEKELTDVIISGELIEISEA